MTISPPHHPPGDIWHKTACILCECNCGIEVRLDGRRFERIRGDKEHAASAGYTCEKALRLNHYQNFEHRLTTPLRRRPDGTYEPIDWDTATREIAERLASVRDRFGGESIFFYGGGGQGNHLGGPYLRALMGALGARYRSNALSQEKTGEFWVDARVVGGHSRGDFEHAQVAVFIGKNPWQSHSIPQARRTLKAIAADDGRTLVVIDPVRTETAELADFHLQVRPGTDAWCLAALAAVLVQEDLLDRSFLDAHTAGTEEVIAALAAIPVDEYAAHAGVDPAVLRHLARRMAEADSVSIFEDLGVQQAPNSTLCSYLDKLLWILVGSFAKPGGMNIHTELVSLTKTPDRDEPRTPVLGERIIAGLVPANVISDEILTDHPARYRAMVIQSANPAHSVADSARFREALATLEVVVVVDVAMTETARCADYVLPAASQYEKWECTFFNFEFPRNVFHLRAPILEPIDGVLPEAEIFSRILSALGVFDDVDLDGLTAAARRSRFEFGAAIGALLAERPQLFGVAPAIAYLTLGPTLPDGAAVAAPLWLVAQRFAAERPEAVRRAGIIGASVPELGNALFDAMLSGTSGVIFSLDDYADTWGYVDRPDGRFALAVPEMLAELAGLAVGPTSNGHGEFPLVLSAGERRSFTANTILRNPSWRKRDPGGALRISPDDAARYGLVDGGSARLHTARGSARVLIEVNDAMGPGHIALPNGLGVDCPDDDGVTTVTGVAPNELTDVGRRDEIAGTPWHKHVPARLEPIETAAAAS